MTSAVDVTATTDGDSPSNALKRRRSSNIIPLESDLEQTPLKRVRSSSPPPIYPCVVDNNNQQIQSMLTSLHDIVETHRNLVREYVDLQTRDRLDLSGDEQRFIQAEEELIDKAEKNLGDVSQNSAGPSSRHGKRQRMQSITSTSPSFDRVRHETHILKRIDELKSDGKWTPQRLAKCLEPDKRKSHWDYLLDEMHWLAEDFALEKRWKQAMAKKISLAILKYFREKNQAESEQQREEIRLLRKQAQFICREVMHFWKNMHKIAEYKETTRIQELQKYQFDSPVVDERSPVPSSRTSDEETIEREEQEEPDEYARHELEELQADQKEPIDVLLRRHYGLDLSDLTDGVPRDREESSSGDEGDDSDMFDDEESRSNDASSMTTDTLGHEQIHRLMLVAQSLQPSGTSLQTTSVRIPVPFLLKHPLRDYQHVALQWLVNAFQNKLNCILADQTGLGKTIETIALLAHLACVEGLWGPHLIIVPTRIMLNWELELKKWCPALKILTYYGSVKERHSQRQEWTKANVCLTSYQWVLRDIESFRRRKWKYLIFDEVQHLHSDRWHPLFDLPSQCRLLLADNILGEDSLTQPGSLIRLLMPNAFASSDDFSQWLCNPFPEKLEQRPTTKTDSALEYVKNLLRSFVLRRSKSDVERQLPERHEHLLVCDLSKRQRQIYDRIRRSQLARDAIEQGDVQSMMAIVMQLRQVCNHPDLIESRTVVSPLILPKLLIQYAVPSLIVDINLKNPYFGLNSPSKNTFLYFHVKFTLHVDEHRIIEAMNEHIDDEDEPSQVTLTKDIIERYRHSPLWNPSQRPIKNHRNHLKIKPTVSVTPRNEQRCIDDVHHDEHERLSRYESLCRITADQERSRPVYGSDALQQIELAMRLCSALDRTTFSGYASCRRVHERSNRLQDYFSTTDTLRSLIKSPGDILEECHPILERFILCTARVIASSIVGDRVKPNQPFIEVLSSIDHIQQNMLLQYPERRFLHYDCGKLQTLDALLISLKSDQHRCLILTPMIKMLDLLEFFFKSRGYTYLRVDSTTEISQRPMFVEHFNRDAKIFLFISSTRVPGMAVNLTGADTVILYDAEWNWTIDGQPQDRCDQINDIHIYRLISKNTVEETMMKKVEQNQTLDSSIVHPHFTKDDLRDFINQTSAFDGGLRRSAPIEFEQVLGSVEDDIDRQAAEEFCRAKTADTHEFHQADTETATGDAHQRCMLHVEEEFQVLDGQLLPIERYALRYVETNRTEFPFTSVGSTTYLDSEQLQNDWKLSCLNAIREEEKKQLEHDDDDLMYTYSRENEKKVWMTEDGLTFEVWSGLVLKYSSEENAEFYHDEVLDFGYESEIMIIDPEEYIRFPLPKALTDTTNTSKSDTNILVPRSLFDRSNLLLNTQSSSLSTNALNKSKPLSNPIKSYPSASMLTPQIPQANVKARQLYVNNGTTTTPLPTSSNTNVIVSAATSSRPVKLEEMLTKDNFQGLLEIDNSDWLISEDYKVLDAIQNIQQLPLSSISFSSSANANKPQTMLPNSSSSSSSLLPSSTALSSSPSSSMVNNTTNALTQNWDFISDIVNRYSRVLRTPKQCKHRFEQVIGPREEGRVVYDPVKKKKHVIKGAVKLSDDNWQTLRTNQLFLHDNCQKLFQIYNQKFETISQCVSQDSPMVSLNKFKQMQLAHATHHQSRGPKPGSLLHESNIHFDAPLMPSDVFYQRTEKEKEVKQQQQQQQAESAATNPPSQPAASVVASTNVETVKQAPTPPNPIVASTITPRGRPSMTNNPAVASVTSAVASAAALLTPTSVPSIQRSISSNIFVTGNNPQNPNLSRAQSNILSSRSNIPSSPTTAGPSSSTNPTSLPTATIVPGQRTMSVLPPNHLPNEIGTIPQKHVGTVQLSSSEYSHARPSAHPQPTTTTTMITNPTSAASNLQIRAQNYPRNQGPPTTLTTLEVRPQLPSSPKSQPTPSVRPVPTNPRPAAMISAPADHLNQGQAKMTTASINPSSLPVAVVRPLQHSSPSIPSSPTSPMNPPTGTVTIPSSKLSTTTIVTPTTTTTITNPAPQIRTATAYLPSPTASTSQAQQLPQQLRQIMTNAASTSLQTAQSGNPQRFTDATQRPTNNIQLLTSRGNTLPGQVRNVRILTLTTGANPTAAIADATSAGNAQQASGQPTKITYNRANSNNTSFPRSTATIDQDIPPDLAAHLHRIKSFSAANTDPNDSSQTPRAVLVPARTISGASPSSASAASKLKSGSSLDPTTLSFSAKPSQTNIVFQLPSSTPSAASGGGGGGGGADEQSTNFASGFTRQMLMQHFNIIPSNNNSRSQSPTTLAANTQNNVGLSRLLQHLQPTRTPVATATNASAAGVAAHDPSSPSPSASAPSSSSSSSAT